MLFHNFFQVTFLGYVTAYGEDRPEFGAFSSLTGFNTRPTDHYLPPYFLVQNDKLCEGRPNEHNVLLNWTLDFLSIYKNEPKFAFAYSKIAHEEMNNLKLADSDLVEFFEKLKSGGVLENSVVKNFNLNFGGK
jgi:hypothetical protein